LQKENQQLQSEIESIKNHPISTGVTTQRTSTPPPEKKPTEDLQLHKLQQEAHLAEIKRLADENYKYKTIMINEGRNTLLRKINSLKLKLVDTRDALEKAKNNNSLKLDIEKLKSEIQTQKKKISKLMFERDQLQEQLEEARQNKPGGFDSSDSDDADWEDMKNSNSTDLKKSAEKPKTTRN